MVRCHQDFSTDRAVKAAVIQGNIDSAEKWDLSTHQRMMSVYSDLTARAAADGAELVIWPETTITVALNQSEIMERFVSRVAKNYGVTLIVGALYEDETGEYNSLFLVTPEGEISENRYDKRHLVPFGEYVPLRGLISVLYPPLAEVSALDTDLTPGDDPALFDTKWGSIGSMLCFDSIYEILGIESVRDGAELMVISSNDSWFGDSAAVYQHQAQAQYRAIEEGRYLLRAANTGISTILTPTGEILSWLDPLTEGYSVQQICFRTQRTVYSVIGNTFVYLCGLFCIALPIVDFLNRKRLSQKTDVLNSSDETEIA
jgi:apolipoprotein N-acyltransferase